MSPARYNALEREVSLNNGAGSGYALGMEVHLKNDHRVLEHDDAISGYTAENMVIPDSKMAVVGLTNSDASGAAEDIAGKIVDLLLDEKNGDKAVLEKARGVLIGLQQGRFDRSQFSANGNDYFRPAVINETARELAKLGKLESFDLESSSTRGGLVTRIYTARLGKKSFSVVTRAWPDGLFEQYIMAAE
jgi:hypothetical protein